MVISEIDYKKTLTLCIKEPEAFDFSCCENRMCLHCNILLFLLGFNYFTFDQGCGVGGKISDLSKFLTPTP